MKILIIQENGRHLENREFRECFNLQRALLRKNIDTIVWGLGHDNFNTPFQQIIKDIDVIILLENYESHPRIVFPFSRISGILICRKMNATKTMTAPIIE